MFTTQTINENPTITINDKNYEVTIKPSGYNNIKPRVFVSGQPDPQMERPSHYTQKCDRTKEAYHNKLSCGSCIFDAMWRKYNREEIKIQRDILKQVFPHYTGKYSFSRTAGCSCPCSPGFIADPSFGESVHVGLKEVK